MTTIDNFLTRQHRMSLIKSTVRSSDSSNYLFGVRVHPICMEIMIVAINIMVAILFIILLHKCWKNISFAHPWILNLWRELGMKPERNISSRLQIPAGEMLLHVSHQHLLRQHLRDVEKFPNRRHFQRKTLRKMRKGGVHNWCRCSSEWFIPVIFSIYLN